MRGKDKILANSVSGVLMLEVCWYGSHGICIFNHSYVLPQAQKFALEEQRQIDNGKSIPYKRSWRENLRNINEDITKNYHRFNLTESEVVAYVRVDDYTHNAYNSPKALAKLGLEAISKKHLAKYLLTSWIENEGIKVGLNE